MFWFIEWEQRHAVVDPWIRLIRVKKLIRVFDRDKRNMEKWPRNWTFVWVSFIRTVRNTHWDLLTTSSTSLILQNAIRFQNRKQKTFFLINIFRRETNLINELKCYWSQILLSGGSQGDFSTVGWHSHVVKQFISLFSIFFVFVVIIQ